MAVLEHRANGDGELFHARSTLIDASTHGGLAFGLWFQLVNRLLFVVPTMRADCAMWPKHGFEMFSGFFICPETVKQLNQRKVFGGFVWLHG